MASEIFCVMMKKNKSEKDIIEALLIQIYINRNIREKYCEQSSDKDLLKFIGRLVLQKTLFIKEICRLYGMDQYSQMDRFSSQIDRMQKKTLSEQDDHLGPKGMLDMITGQENTLLTVYEELLKHSADNELAKMIVRNHIKELKRDLYALRELHAQEVYQGAG